MQKSTPTKVSQKAPEDVHLAVIVPYRDQPLQNRAEHLKRFIPLMETFLKNTQITHPFLKSYHIYIIEQSEDGYKFNRGKLLNIGFKTALQQNPKTNSFCFHDVDLIPGSLLEYSYAKYPINPIHIGAVWGRYSSAPNYVGGILTMSKDDFEKVNGFPNNFWGWGGEDDELSERMRDNRIQVEKVKKSGYENIQDLEEILIQERGGERAGTRLKEGGREEWKDMRKKEKRAEHKATWQLNGLSNLTYHLLDFQKLAPHTTKHTVDLLGQHDKNAQELPKETKTKRKLATTILIQGLNPGQGFELLKEARSQMSSQKIASYLSF